MKRKYYFIALIVLWTLLAGMFIFEFVSSAQEDRNIRSFILQMVVCLLGIASMIFSLLDLKKKHYRDIYFAGGCFWGAQKYFKLVKGVVATEVGYANGNTENPTYEQVYTDTTGYAECVRVTFDTYQTTVRRLTEKYFKAIDPTSLNQQGEDKGTRYRTGVYFIDDKEGDGSILKQVFEEQERIYGTLAVELMPIKNFVRAEDYHQDYLDKNPDGYCHLSPEIFKNAAE